MYRPAIHSLSSGLAHRYLAALPCMSLDPLAPFGDPPFALPEVLSWLPGFLIPLSPSPAPWFPRFRLSSCLSGFSWFLGKLLRKACSRLVKIITFTLPQFYFRN